MGLSAKRAASTLPAMALMAGACVALSACVTSRTVERSGLPATPKPRAVKATPSTAIPNRMAIIVSPKAEDSNGNGFPDTIRIVTVLFAMPHPLSMQAEGAFVFELFRQGEAASVNAEPIARWRLEGAALEGTLGEALYGPCYNLALSLEGRVDDRMPPTAADLRGRFECRDGTVVSASAEVRRVQLGSGFHVAGRE